MLLRFWAYRRPRWVRFVGSAFVVAGILAVVHVHDDANEHEDCSMCMAGGVVDKPACDTTITVLPHRPSLSVQPLVPLNAGPVPIAAAVSARGPPSARLN
ncbi:MAG: hypothetical protein AAGH76_16500 [Pseudomonadota bacterium]